MSELLTVDQLREHVTSSLGDDALQRYIDAEDALITARMGPVGQYTDVRFPRGATRVFLLGRAPASIVSVTERLWENDTVLEPDDYIVVNTVLRRLDTGPHPIEPYTDRVTIVYTSADDSAIRTLALIKLCALDIADVDAMAVVSRTVGLHTVMFASAEARSQARDDVWAELTPASQPFLA